MWFVFRQGKGCENIYLHNCIQNREMLMHQNAFTFTYDCMKRYEGSWHMERRLLFPEYVFVEADHKEILNTYFNISHKGALIAGSEMCLLTVGREEEVLLRCLCGKTHHLKMSRGYIKNGVTHVVEGPLRGREYCIQKIDRHKRLAKINVSDRNGLGEMVAGLEIMEKS